MNSTGFGAHLAGMAHRLAEAAARGTLAELEDELHRTQCELDEIPMGRRGTTAGEDERVELLGAVVQAMRRSAARSSRQITSGPEGREIHIRLLRHLARSPRSIQPQNPLFYPAVEPSPASRPYYSLARAV